MISKIYSVLQIFIIILLFISGVMIIIWLYQKFFKNENKGTSEKQNNEDAKKMDIPFEDMAELEKSAYKIAVAFNTLEGTPWFKRYTEDEEGAMVEFRKRSGTHYLIILGNFYSQVTGNRDIRQDIMQYLDDADKKEVIRLYNI